jgi:hypothetical protein
MPFAALAMLPIGAPWNPNIYAPEGQTYEQHASGAPQSAEPEHATPQSGGRG